MSRSENPLREHLGHMHLEVLSSILLESPVALLIIKEEVCSAQAIHLHML